MMNKNKRGQMNIGTIIMLFIGAIVVLSLMGPIFDNQSVMTDTVSAVNSTVTAGVIGTAVDMTGQELFGTPIVSNATATLTETTDYTIAEGISATTNGKTVQYTPNSGNASSQDVTVSYTYGADGYIEDSGGRSVAGLIGLFSTLALLGFMLLGIKNDWFS